MHDSPTDPDLPAMTMANPEPQAERQPVVVRSFGGTDRGRVRPSNQDQFLIAVLNKALRIEQSSLPHAGARYGSEQGHILLVADGLGGAQGGEEASALVLETIEEFLLETLKWFFHLQGPEKENVVSEFQAAFSLADSRLFEQARGHPELRGMGTTLTMAYTLDSDLFVVHVGDSRCYLFRQDELHRLTRDHTLVQNMVQQGLIRPEQAPSHRLRHVVTNVVGGHEPGVEVEVHKVPLEQGDVLLLSTDGLTEMLPDKDIASILRAERDPRAACQRLLAEANDRGGVDNITTVVARFEAPGQ